MVRRKHVMTAVVAFSVLMFTTLLCTYPTPDPERFFQYATRLLQGPVPPGRCACMGPCVADLRGDAWFSERFNETFHPFLTKESSALSEEVFSWWLRLQPAHNGANYSQVTEELFSLFVGMAQHQDGEAGRCRRCAVVGNSGNLKGSFYGRMIDSNDLVIRMNRGQTQGFEEHVGVRTTHHILYPESAIHLGPDTSLVLVPFKIRDLQWLISAFTTGTITWTYQKVMSKITANKEKVQVLSPAFMKYAYENWTVGHGRYPSTGFFSLMFALHMCDEVSVFGYGADVHGNWDHYWENNDAAAFRRTGVHGGGYEYNITAHLARTNRVRMFPPPPPTP